MGLTIVDGVVIAFMLISTFLAWSRGLTSELLSIAGWILAALFAFWAFPMLQPVAREFVNSDNLAKWAAAIAAFAGAMVVITVITPVISRMIHNSALSPLDKGFGLLFGAARGLALVSVAYIGYAALERKEENRLEAVRNAQSLPLITSGADLIISLAPEEMPAFMVPVIEELLGSGSTKI